MAKHHGDGLHQILLSSSLLGMTPDVRNLILSLVDGAFGTASNTPGDPLAGNVPLSSDPAVRDQDGVSLTKLWLGQYEFVLFQERVHLLQSVSVVLQIKDDVTVAATRMSDQFAGVA